MKVVEYDRLARQPCRGRAAGVDHLSEAPLGYENAPRIEKTCSGGNILGGIEQKPSRECSELPLPDEQRRPRSIRTLLRRSRRTLAVTRTASGRASTADFGGNSGQYAPRIEKKCLGGVRVVREGHCASCGETSLPCLRSEAAPTATSCNMSRERNSGEA